MSDDPTDEELERLREERMEQLREQAGGQQQEGAREAAQQQAEAQKQAILRQYLTDGARKRLNTVEMSKPQRAKQVEQQIIALAQSGRLQEKIDEDQMKQLLRELSDDSQDFNIRRR
jgi:programmed cell death protein 5